MNQVAVLLTIRGGDFDANVFANKLPTELCGEVKILRNWTADMPELCKSYWTSPRKVGTTDSNFEDWIVDLVRDYSVYLNPVCGSEKTAVTCNVVTHFESADTVHGFWFSPQVIRLLAQFNIGIDVDSYCYDDNEDGMK